jgi:DnaA family protein
MRQLPLALGPTPDCTFESFLPGANAAALQHLRTLGASAAPVYLWGPSGSGKTHLLRALASRVQGAGGVVGSFDAGMGLPWVLDAGWSLAIVDRCDELSEEAQRAAFALFEDAAAEGVPFAAAGRLPPVDLPLRDDLRTRLGWGHVFALASLTEPETRAALRREADRRGIFLGDEVMSHLLTHCPRDLASLMQVIDRLDDFSMSKSRHVTVPLLRQMLAEEDRREGERGGAAAGGDCAGEGGSAPLDEGRAP